MKQKEIINIKYKSGSFNSIVIIIEMFAICCLKITNVYAADSPNPTISQKSKQILIIDSLINQSEQYSKCAKKYENELNEKTAALKNRLAGFENRKARVLDSLITCSIQMKKYKYESEIINKDSSIIPEKKTRLISAVQDSMRNEYTRINESKICKAIQEEIDMINSDLFNKIIDVVKKDDVCKVCYLRKFHYLKNKNK